jgi:thiamine pyrophosphokinase
MSSHHIVKDKQEPALIIANGLHCSDMLLGQLLEWSPFVMVLDSAIHRVLKKGIKIDALLGDFDKELNIEEISALQHPLEIIHTPDQDKTDLEKGIEYLVEQGHRSANIIWAGGLRADHNLNNLSSIVKYKKHIDIVMLDDWSRIYCLPEKFEKWYARETKISLMPMPTAGGITTSGLKYNLENASLELGTRTSSSNEALEDGMVKVYHSEGHLLMMECWD